jgi:hypothetical protein
MATFNNSAAYSILSTQKGTYYVQSGHYFSPTTFVDLGTTAPTDYQSLSSERSDSVRISGGLLDGVTIGPNSTSSAGSSGATITNPTLTGGTIDNTPIGQSTPAAGAFTTLNSTSANILGPLIGEGVSSSANAQAPSPTNSGIAWGSSPTWAMQSFYDQSNSANNRAADMLFISGSIKFRFANDARNAFLDVLSITGGQASGVTGITSTSGAGTWAHTGNLTVTNYVGSLDTGSLPGFSGSSGAFLYAGNGFESLMLQRIGNAAGDRRAYVGFSGPGIALGFFNDQTGTQTPAITVAGGAASGISGITSTSGTGSWAHTGAFSATGTITPSTTNGVVGTTLADNANAGSIGEVITNTGTNVSLTTAVSANVTSVTLTAGDWDVNGSIAFNGTSSTSTSRVVGGLSTVSATLPAQPYYYQHQYGVGGFTSATLPNGSVPMQRINVSTITTVYLVAQATFTASTETATGVIIARRAR